MAAFPAIACIACNRDLERSSKRSTKGPLSLKFGRFGGSNRNKFVLAVETSFGLVCDICSRAQLARFDASEALVRLNTSSLEDDAFAAFRNTWLENCRKRTDEAASTRVKRPQSTGSTEDKDATLPQPKRPCPGPLLNTPTSKPSSTADQDTLGASKRTSKPKLAKRTAKKRSKAIATDPLPEPSFPIVKRRNRPI